jgi:hypothetical protein
MIHQQPIDASWSSFIHLLVNVPRRFETERPALHGIARQGTMAHLLFAVAARPRLSLPVSAFPEFRRAALAELLEVGELLRCTSERGSAHVAPTILLEAVRQLSPRWRDRLLAGDPVAGIWPAWIASAPPPRPLTEVACDVLVHADAAGTLAATAEQLAAVAAEMGLTEVAALVRGAAPEHRVAPRAGDRLTMAE